MKRMLACCLAIVLLLSLTALSEATVFGQLEKRQVFSVRYDEKLLELDTEYFSDTSDEYTVWQFILYNDHVSIDCTIDIYDDDMSLFLMSENEIDAYGQTLTDVFPGFSGKYTGIHYVRVSDGRREARLPFVTLRYSKKGEPDSFYAETVAHGVSIWFDCQRMDSTLSDEKAQALLNALLDSFSPVL